MYCITVPHLFHRWSWLLTQCLALFVLIQYRKLVSRVLTEMLHSQEYFVCPVNTGNLNSNHEQNKET